MSIPRSALTRLSSSSRFIEQIGTPQQIYREPASAFVADAKVCDYLLDPAHPNNGGNAGFFRRFGFTQQHWPDLQNALRFHPHANPVAIITRNPYGIR